MLRVVVDSAVYTPLVSHKLTILLYIVVSFAVLRSGLRDEESFP